MLSVTIVSLKILTETFCNCSSYENVLIIAKGKSQKKKTLIVKLQKDCESYRNIPNNLNIPFTTISSFITMFKRRYTVEKKRTGAPRKISPRLSRKLGRLINQNPIVKCEELQEDLHSSGWNVTKRTISNEMLGNDLQSRRPKKTPLLLKRHAMLNFVSKHKENSFWEKVLWTDETKIDLFGHNHRNNVCVWGGGDGEAYSPKNTVPAVKFGDGSIMIWGCFSAKGMGKISVIDGKWIPKSINRSCKKSWHLLLRVLSYLRIKFSSRIMIPSIQLNLWRSGCLKIILMFCNGQVSPRIWIQLGTWGDFWKFKSEKEH